MDSSGWPNSFWPNDFWKERRVFITGHTGFKGAWLCLWLEALGARVTGYALAPPTQPSLFELTNVASGMHSIVGDINNATALQSAIQQAQPEIVLHLAAQALVRPSYQNPVQTYATNVMGTVNLLEAVRHVNGIKAVLVVSSDKCYDNANDGKQFVETDPLGGLDPYSSSKACVELVTASYRNAYFQDATAVASARAGNVVGGGDWAEDRLIPDMVRAIANNQAVNIRNPNAIRPWQHVLEPLGGYLMLAEQLVRQKAAVAQAWNFGPAENEARNVGWLAKQFVGHFDQKITITHEVAAHQLHEASYLQLDCNKAHQQLGWQAVWQIQKSLEATANWYDAYFKGENMRDFSLSQIAEYGCEWQKSASGISAAVISGVAA